MRKSLLFLAGVALLLSPTAAHAASESEVQLPAVSFTSPGVVKWQTTLNTSINPNQVFLGYSLGVKSDPTFKQAENLWARYGRFAVKPGACGKQAPSPQEFFTLSNGKRMLPQPLTGSRNQVVCVWGKLPPEAHRIYDNRDRAYTLDEARRDKHMFVNNGQSYYKNTVTVRGTGTVSSKEVTDNDWWETFMKKGIPPKQGQVKLVYAPKFIDTFKPLLPETGGVGSNVFLFSGISLSALAFIGYLLKLRFGRKGK